MTELNASTKLPAGPDVAIGMSVINSFLSRKDDAGIIMGVSRFSPGATDSEVRLDEVLYILAGEIGIERNGKSDHLVEGDCYWMPKGKPVTYRAEQPCEFIYILIKDTPDR